MIKLLYPEVKPHHWIVLSVLAVVCACMRDWGVSEVSQSGVLLTAALIYGGAKAVKGIANYYANKRDTKDQREAYAKGAKMLKKGYTPPGSGQAGSERIRAAGTQQVQAATRGIEAETRRANQGNVGGSQLATLAIMNKQKASMVPGIEGQVTAANEASKQGQYARFANRAGALMGTGPAPLIGSPAGAIAEGVQVGATQYAGAKAQQQKNALSAAYLKTKGADLTGVGNTGVAVPT